jgi:hypothetical protein
MKLLGSQAQVTITNSSFNSYNVTPNTLCRVSILNSGAAGQVYMEAEVRNAANEPLLTIKTNPFTLNQGLNNPLPNVLSFNSTQYSTTNQGEFLRTQNKLPSGAYTYCIRVIPISGIEEGDEYCESIDANEDAYLYLVYPAHEEVIETTQPVLMWMHSEAFNLLSQGEFFKITVVELSKEQSAESGLSTNVPVFTKNYLNAHQVPYPQDAHGLEPGKRYGWHVQKISNGNVVARTEAWEFSIAKTVDNSKKVHVVIKKTLDGSVYMPQNDIIYFRFDERYVSTQLVCKIYNEKRELLIPTIENEQNNTENVKALGMNTFELDLNTYKLKKGYYILEVFNEKNEKYQLKFYVEK